MTGSGRPLIDFRQGYINTKRVPIGNSLAFSRKSNMITERELLREPLREPLREFQQREQQPLREQLRIVR